MFTARHCIHGQCIGHAPQYEVLEVSVIPTHFLGLRINLLHRCCGRFMRIVKKVEHLTCTACGARHRNHIPGFVQCECCRKLVYDRGDSF
jgi:hypothetical protein